MKVLKRVLGAIFILSSLMFVMMSGTAFAQNEVNASLFMPFSYVEYKELDSPVDILVEDDMTVILENGVEKQQLIIYKDGAYKTYSTSSNAENPIEFNETLYVKKLSNYLIYQYDYRPYFLNIETGEYAELKNGDNYIPCDYFGVSDNYFASYKNHTITIYSVRIEANKINLTEIKRQTNADVGDIEIFENYLFYFNSEKDLCRINLENFEEAPVVFDTNVSGTYLICNEKYAYLSYNEGITRVDLEKGEVLSFNANIAFNKLGDIVAPKGLAFKDDFVLVCDKASNTIQGLNKEDFSFTGYAIATTEPCDTRGSDKVIDITTFNDKVYLLDQTKIIITDGKKIESLSYSIPNFTPNAITTNGEVALLNSSTELVFINLKDGEVLGRHTEAFICETTFVDGEFFALTSEIYNDFNGKLINVTPTSTTLNKLNLNGISQNDLITSDVEGNLYVYVKNTNKVHLLTKDGRVVLENDVPKTFDATVVAVDMTVDLTGNIFLLTENNEVEKISTDNTSKVFTVTVDSRLKSAQIKKMAMSFDKKEVYFAFNKEGYIAYTTNLENDNIIDVIDSIDETNFLKTADTVDTEKMTFGTIKENECVYYFEDEYLGYSKNDNLHYSVAGETQGFYILVGTDTAICRKENFEVVNSDFFKTTDKTFGFVSTPVSIYYHPVINESSEYALTNQNEKVRLEKNTKIELISTFTFVGKEIVKDFYYIKTEVNGSEIYGFVPTNFIVYALAQKVESQNITYKELTKNAKLYADKELLTELSLTPNKVKVLSTAEIMEVEFEVEGTTYIAYISADSIASPAKTAVRKVVIIIVLSLAVFTPSMFILRKRKTY